MKKHRKQLVKENRIREAEKDKIWFKKLKALPKNVKELVKQKFHKMSQKILEKKILQNLNLKYLEAKEEKMKK